MAIIQDTAKRLPAIHIPNVTAEELEMFGSALGEAAAGMALISNYGQGVGQGEVVIQMQNYRVPKVRITVDRFPAKKHTLN